MRVSRVTRKKALEFEDRSSSCSVFCNARKIEENSRKTRLEAFENMIQRDGDIVIIREKEWFRLWYWFPRINGNARNVTLYFVWRTLKRNYNLLLGIVGRCFRYLYVPTILYIEISRKLQFFLIYERNEIKSLRFFFFQSYIFLASPLLISNKIQQRVSIYKWNVMY